MADQRATVGCPDCEFEEAFRKLAAARERIADHRDETGHSARWDLHELSSGVEQAGEEAGVCGRPECTDEESALFRDDL
jgi:hypothetical protein